MKPAQGLLRFHVGGPALVAMKKLRWSTLLGLVLLSGCAHHYDITLTNGNTLTTSSKPKINKAGDAYVFKDANGVVASVPRGRVKEIAPR